MTAHQGLALAVRLFAIWCALVLVREIGAVLISSPPIEESGLLAFVIGGYVVSVVVLLFLWFFPISIARGLLPRSSEIPEQTLSYSMWFALGVALIGLWFVASAIGPILRNLSVLYFYRPDLMNTETLRSLRVGIFYYSVEFVLGLCLLFGSRGIRKLVGKASNASSN